ncbi:MAG: hypothetical protein ACQETR_16610, partial [Thermodesulfobacteriota bacterium]
MFSDQASPILLNTVPSSLLISWPLCPWNEQVSLLQILGLAIAVVAMILLTAQMTADTPSLKRRQQGAVLIFLALLGGATASVSSKFAAMYADKFAFMAMSYLFGMIGSLGINKALSYKKA